MKAGMPALLRRFATVLTCYKGLVERFAHNIAHDILRFGKLAGIVRSNDLSLNVVRCRARGRRTRLRIADTKNAMESSSDIIYNVCMYLNYI